MRIGLIGAGRIGALHAATLSSLPSVTGLLITDIDGALARAAADKVGAETADTLADPLGARNTCPGEEALAALLVAEAADLSRREGRPVRVAEVAR